VNKMKYKYEDSIKAIAKDCPCSPEEIHKALIDLIATSQASGIEIGQLINRFNVERNGNKAILDLEKRKYENFKTAKDIERKEFIEEINNLNETNDGLKTLNKILSKRLDITTERLHEEIQANINLTANVELEIGVK